MAVAEVRPVHLEVAPQMRDVVERAAGRRPHERVDVRAQRHQRVGQVRAHEAVGTGDERRAAAVDVREVATQLVEVALGPDRRRYSSGRMAGAVGFPVGAQGYRFHAPRVARVGGGHRASARRPVGPCSRGRDRRRPRGRARRRDGRLLRGVRGVHRARARGDRDPARRSASARAGAGRPAARRGGLRLGRGAVGPRPPGARRRRRCRPPGRRAPDRLRPRGGAERSRGPVAPDGSRCGRAALCRPRGERPRRPR